MSGCFRAFGGWLAGCVTATAVIVGVPTVFAFVSASGRAPTNLNSFRPLLGTSLFIFIVICVMTAIPAFLTIGWSMASSTRSIVFFGAAGSMLGASCISLLARSAFIWTSGIGSLFVTAGFAAGVAYWWVAGRHAKVAPRGKAA
jgi:hypothetical protein